MKRGAFNGWPLVAWAATAVCAMSGFVLIRWGAGDEGLRMGIRATARSSWTLFLAVYVTAAWHGLRPGTTSRWLLRNRRYLGVSLAVSQFFHALFIGRLFALDRAAFFARVDTVTIAGGALGYVFLALMAATSFDRTAAWLGRQRWRVLHTAGIHYLWLVFAFSYGARALVSPGYSALFLPLVAGLVLRVAHRGKARRAPQTRLVQGPGHPAANP